MKKIIMKETRLFTLNLELGILAIRNEIDIIFNKIRVTTTSARLRTFLKGMDCVKCAAKASHFAVDITYEGKRPHYHLNLYATKDGVEVLMTSDHIHPKSLGGGGGLSNRQPMCRTCNFEKGAKVE